MTSTFCPFIFAAFESAFICGFSFRSIFETTTSAQRYCFKFARFWFYLRWAIQCSLIISKLPFPNFWGVHSTDTTIVTTIFVGVYCHLISPNPSYKHSTYPQTATRDTLFQQQSHLHTRASFSLVLREFHSL